MICHDVMHLLLKLNFAFLATLSKLSQSRSVFTHLWMIGLGCFFWIIISQFQSIKLWDLRKFSSSRAIEETRKAVCSQNWDYRWQNVPKHRELDPLKGWKFRDFTDWIILWKNLDQSYNLRYMLPMAGICNRKVKIYFPIRWLFIKIGSSLIKIHTSKHYVGLTFHRLGWVRFE